jgi:hypothetical protein
MTFPLRSQRRAQQVIEDDSCKRRAGSGGRSGVGVAAWTRVAVVLFDREN